jgi:HK97 family phage portal protein
MGLFDGLLSGIVAPKAWLVQMLGGGQTASGKLVTPYSALESSAVYGCVDLIGATVASLPIYTMQKVSGALKQVSTELQFYLNEDPNVDLTGYTLKFGIVQNLLLKGEAFLLPIYQGGRLAGIRLLRHEWVAVWEDSDAVLTYQVTQPGQPLINLRAWQIVHIRQYTVDGIRGVSPITYAREVIGTSIAADQHQGAFMTNGGTPRGVLSLATTIRDKDRIKNLRDQFDEQVRGLNAGKTAVLTEGAEYKTIQLSNADLQFIESQKFSTEQICRIFRVPPSMVGFYVGTQTGTNAEQDALRFVRQCLAPMCANIENELTKKLGGTYWLKFDLNEWMRGDSTARTQRIVSLINAGVMTQNEGRKEEGLPYYGPEADELKQPLNLAPIGDVNNGKINKDGTD